ncbi:MAG: TIGR02391 family protein, partial [Clostridia bacterium]|nr:TIGR02391 family protein [Clostridia bacterium]
RKTYFDLNATAVSLSKLFNCFDEKSFIVKIKRNDTEEINLTKELQYSGISKEFEWDIESIVKEIDDEYQYKNCLKGKILSTKKPMDQSLRGITLYVNGRLANVAGFFGVPEAGYVFSYISGWIEADFLDEFDKDLIATDRQSISWDLLEAEQLKDYLYKIIRYVARDWSKKRKEAKTTKTTTRSGVNIRDWFEHVPQEVKPKLQDLVDRISDKPELSDEDFTSVVKNVYDLIPPYTYYHYRLLHEQIRDAAEKYYKDKNYYQAFYEAMKRYKNAVKEKANISESEDRAIVSKAFGKDAVLETTANHKYRPNGQLFDIQTIENIEEGQKFLSMGAVCGGRNVVSHEEISDLKEAGLFSEKDCLDLLSLLSHLFKRLDESKKRT